MVCHHVGFASDGLTGSNDGASASGSDDEGDVPGRRVGRCCGVSCCWCCWRWPHSDGDARDGGIGSSDSDAGASASDGEGDEWMNVSSHQYVWPGWHVKVLACKSDMQHVHTCCEPCACLGMIGLCTIVSPMLIWLTFFLCGPLGFAWLLCVWPAGGSPS